MVALHRCVQCSARQAEPQRLQPLRGARQHPLRPPAPASARKLRSVSFNTAAVQGPASDTGAIHGPVDTEILEGYTPHYFVSYSDDRSEHEISVTVQSDGQTCFDTWAERRNHFDFLTLAENIAYDGPDSDLAAYMFFYRYAQMPALQIICDIRRTSVVPGEKIAFENSGDSDFEGAELPLSGEVLFQDNGDGATTVTLSTSIGLPNLYKDRVGVTELDRNLHDILTDLLKRFKALVEK